MASDLGFKFMGGSTYRITLKIYRDCMGDSIRGNPDSAFWFAGNNGSKGTAFKYIKLTRISIKDVTPVCSTSTSGCNPANTKASGKGVEEHVYIADLDLSNSAFTSVGLGSTFCELNVVFKSCCRNTAITTGASGEAFYTQTSMNICNLNKCKNNRNSTGNFYTKPVIFGNCNQANYFNLSATDTADFDSLAYQMVMPLKGWNTAATLSSPFSYLKPLTPYCVPSGVNCAPNKSANPPRGFFFDSVTGDFVFTPTQCTEVSIFTAAVNEFRRDTSGKWVLISTGRREMQCAVADPGYNNPPTLSGNTTYKVCEGDKLCFSISGKDVTFTPNQTVPDTVDLSWDGGIPQGTFRIKVPAAREKEAEFCWQTRVGDASYAAYSFTVMATDNHCPKPSKTYRTFYVKVMPRAAASRSYRCLDSGKVEMKATISAGFQGPASYKWSVRDSNGVNESFYSTKIKDTAYLGVGVKHVIVHTINNSANCPVIYRDTVVCYKAINAANPIRIIEFNFTPNPIHAGEKFDLPANFKGRIEWYTADGKLVYTNIQNSSLGIVPQIAPGFYLLHLVEGETKRVARVLVK